MDLNSQNFSITKCSPEPSVFFKGGLKRRVNVDFLGLSADLFSGLDEATSKLVYLDVRNQVFDPVSVRKTPFEFFILLG